MLPQRRQMNHMDRFVGCTHYAMLIFEGIHVYVCNDLAVTCTHHVYSCTCTCPSTMYITCCTSFVQDIKNIIHVHVHVALVGNLCCLPVCCCYLVMEHKQNNTYEIREDIFILLNREVLNYNHKRCFIYLLSLVRIQCTYM